jgi:hypothetical protein
MYDFEEGTRKMRVAIAYMLDPVTTSRLFPPLRWMYLTQVGRQTMADRLSACSRSGNGSRVKLKESRGCFGCLAGASSQSFASGYS